MSKGIQVSHPTYGAGSNEVVTKVFVNGEKKKIRFRSTHGPLSLNQDWTVPITMFAGMRLGVPVEFEGEVSPLLLSRLPAQQSVYRAWYPGDFTNVEIRAPKAKQCTHESPKGVGTFFSGGVDSYFTFHRHTEEITHLLFVNGLDSATRSLMDDSADVSEATREIERLTKELDRPLVVVDTDLRDFLDGYADYGLHYHGAALAAVCHLHEHLFGKVYIASTYPYHQLCPWGSHPLTDFAWSTERLELELDGCEASRVDKIVDLASRPDGLNHLYVCWRNPLGTDYQNCGQCAKCLRTMLTLEIIGKLKDCPSFNMPLDLRAVSRAKVNSDGARYFLEDNLKLARERGQTPAVEKALAEALDGKYHKGILGGLRSLAQRIRAR